jgi:O-antigen/teichoic acid export membrane protein
MAAVTTRARAVEYRYVVARFAVEGATRIASFVTFPLIVQGLGAEAYGVHAQLTAITGLLIPVATLGLGFSVVRVIAGRSDVDYVTARLVSTFTTVILVAAALGVALALAAPLVNDLFIRVDGATAVIRWSAALMVMAAAETTLGDYYRARLRLVAHSVAQVASAGGTVLATVLVLRSGGTLLELVQATVAVRAAVVMALLAYLVVAGEVRPQLRWIPRGELRGLIASGVPVVITGTSAWLISLSDRTVIGYYLTATDVAVYAAAYAIAMLLASLGGPFWAPMYPLMAAHLQEERRAALTAVCRRYSSAYLAVGVPALVGLTLLSSDLIGVFASGELFVSPVLFLMIAAALFADQSSTNAHYLVYLHNETAFLRNAMLTSGVANVILTVALVPLVGINGAAFATLVSYVGLDLALFSRVRSRGYRVSELYDLPALGRYVGSAGLMAMLLVAVGGDGAASLRDMLWLSVLGMVAYGTCLFALNGFRFAVPDSGS